MNTESIRAIPGVLAVLEGAKPGAEVVIVAGVHGNEPCGAVAMQSVIPQVEIKKGRVTFVLGNLKALDSGVRFVEQNLNRLFRPDEGLSDAQRNSYEYRRSRELMPLFKQADYLLDIHSSGTRDTTPFVICDRNGVELASRLPFPLISYGWDVLEPGGTDDFVTASGGVGICIECGHHDDPLAAGRAKESILKLLEIAGLIDVTSNPEATQLQKHVEVMTIHKTKTDFTPARYFYDFEPVQSGMPLGTDGSEEIVAPYDAVVIFSRKRENPNEEAFILGRLV